MKDWIGKATKQMQKRGTAGSFTAAAKRRGKSVSAYANEVIRRYKGKKKTPAQLKLFRRAVFARNMERMRRKK